MLRWWRKGGVGDGTCLTMGDTVVPITMINPEMLRSAVRWLPGAGPSVLVVQTRVVVNQLHSQARRAPEIVVDIIGLSEATITAQEVPILIVDRTRWARAITDSAGGLLEPVLTAGAGKPADSFGSIELALGTSVFAARTLGQYDPLAKRLLLAAPNTTVFAAKCSLGRHGLSLWTLVRELTHAARFTAVSWIADYLVSRLRSLLEQDDADFESGSAAEAMFMISLLEGRAEFVMNVVPFSLIPSKRRSVSSMERHRAAKDLLKSAFPETLGPDLKMAQCRKSPAFVDMVVDIAGYAGPNKVWENSSHTPTLEEIDAPGAWIQHAEA